MSFLDIPPWPSDPDALVNFRQVVTHRLPLSRATLWRMANEGILPQPIRVGRNLWWPAREIDAYVAEMMETRTIKVVNEPLRQAG